MQFPFHVIALLRGIGEPVDVTTTHTRGSRRTAEISNHIFPSNLEHLNRHVVLPLAPVLARKGYKTRRAHSVDRYGGSMVSFGAVGPGTMRPKSFLDLSSDILDCASLVRTGFEP